MASLLCISPSLISVATAILCNFFKDTLHFPLKDPFYIKSLHIDDQIILYLIRRKMSAMQKPYLSH